MSHQAICTDKLLRLQCAHQMMFVAGSWVVSSRWLYESLEAHQFLPEFTYESTYFAGIERARRALKEEGGKGLLTGKVIYVADGTKPEPEVLQELVTAAGAEVRNTDTIVLLSA